MYDPAACLVTEKLHNYFGYSEPYKTGSHLSLTLRGRGDVVLDDSEND